MYNIKIQEKEYLLIFTDNAKSSIIEEDIPVVLEYFKTVGDKIVSFKNNEDFMFINENIGKTFLGKKQDKKIIINSIMLNKNNFIL